ncbi:MAG TPA: tetratricopeptide repeat protein [Alphaproteobacteria bacterium]|nr:tetratricopeptide repeat protein [Alphaproteobacteria bacterium]
MTALPTIPVSAALAARAEFERGRAMAREGNRDAAIAAYSAATARDPEYAEAHNNLANLLRALGDTEDAAKHYETAARCKPDYALAHFNLACLRQTAGQHGAARDAYGKAIAAKPDWAEPHYNLATIDREAGDAERAAAGFRRAVTLDPGHGGGWNNLGLMMRRLGRHAEALAAHARSMSADPDNPRARFNAGMAHLTLGGFEAGWPLYEARIEIASIAKMAGLRTGIPRWRGEPLGHRTLLVEAEQGLGDTVQFVRYLPLLRSRRGAEDASVTLACDRAMLRLLSGFPGVDRLLEKPPRRMPLPRGHDLVVSLMSLPAIFETNAATIPATVPYLHPHPALIAQWAPRVDGTGAGGFKVGLVWAGRPQHDNDRNRSISLEDMAPLAKIRGVALYSLQKGPAEAALADPPTGMNITPLGGRAADFADTAAAIANLDLVISVDTAVAHLAGALGKPVWTLLPYVPDWRWLLERADSPWYPTMQLFRQAEPGDWAGVIETVVKTLRAELRKRKPAAKRAAKSPVKPAAKLTSHNIASLEPASPNPVSKNRSRK